MVNLKVISVNIRGLLNNLICIQSFINEYMPDILVLNETWLTKQPQQIHPKYISLHHYNDKLAGKGHGGTSILIEKKHEEKIEQIKIEIENAVVISIYHTILVGIYIQPKTKPSLLKKIVQKTKDIAHQKGYELIIAGDLNCRLGKVTQDAKLNTLGRQLITLMNTYELKIPNNWNQKTFWSSRAESTLDYFLFSRGLEESSLCCVLKECIGTSDHYPIEASIRLKDDQMESIQNVLVLPKLKNIFPKINIEDMKDEKKIQKILTGIDFDLLHNTPWELVHINIIWEGILTHWQLVLLNTISVKVKEKQGKKFTNPKLKDKRIKQKKLKKRLRKTTRLMVRYAIKEKIAELSKEIRTLSREAKLKTLNKICEETEKETNQEVIKKFSRRLSFFKTNSRRKENLITPNIYASHLLKIMRKTEISTDSGSIPINSEPNSPGEKNNGSTKSKKATEYETSLLIGLLINKLPKRKAPGTDGIIAEFLQLAPKEFAKLLTPIFLHCEEKGIIPKQWKKGIIVPLHKGGPRQLPASYRPITLQSLVRKLFELWIKTDIDIPLSFHQGGFRKAMGTYDQALALHVTLEKNQGAYVTFLDIRNAYDSVDHEILLAKLKEKGLDETTLRLVQELITNQEIYAIINDEVSDGFIPSAGVPQGSVLSPLLYSLFIDDLAQKLNEQGSLCQPLTPLKNCLKKLVVRSPLLSTHHTKVAALFYADDIVLIAQTTEEMQELLSTCEEYAHSHNFRFNTQKCATFNENKKLLLFGEAIPYVKEFKYLGMYFTPTGFAHARQVAYTLSKANQVLHATMKAGLLKAGKLGIRIQYSLLVYKIFIRPILEYGAPLFSRSTGTTNLIELFQNKCLYLASGERRKPTIHTLRGLLATPSIQTRQLYLQAKFLTNLKNEPIETKPATIAYAALLNTKETASPMAKMFKRNKLKLPMDWLAQWTKDKKRTRSKNANIYLKNSWKADACITFPRFEASLWVKWRQAYFCMPLSCPNCSCSSLTREHLIECVPLLATDFPHNLVTLCSSECDMVSHVMNNYHHLHKDLKLIVRQILLKFLKTCLVICDQAKQAAQEAAISRAHAP